MIVTRINDRIIYPNDNRINYPNEEPNNNIYPNNQPNKLPESSDRIESTRITRPNNNYPNKRPNGNETFGQNSGNLFGPHSCSDIKFGNNSGNIFGQHSGNDD
jgi:hypothetical protein